MGHRENTRERERDQTHSYWYIPSAPRENYSLLVMKSTGMMKMATGEGLTPPAGCRNRSRLVFGGYGGFWRRNSRSIVLPDVLGYMEIYRQKKYVRGATRGPRGWRARPLPRGLLVASLTWTPSLSGCFPSKNKFREVSGQLDSVWFSFCEILRNNEITETTTRL